MKKKAILAVIPAAIAVTAVKAAFFVPKKKDYGEQTPEKVDTQRAIRHISGAIQVPTVSYPDKSLVDWTEFERFHKFLETEYPLIHKNLTKEVLGEANLLFCWKGKNPELDPMALLSHQDVVPIEAGTEDAWTHPAFDGVVDDEFIWGRGAMDMKNHLICVMEAVETLLEEGFEPERDVYLCFGQDEEVVASADAGAKKIMETLKSRGVHLDSVLDEGGAILPVDIKGVINKKFLAGIGVAEKGYADFEITVNAKGGHSSQPPQHTAIGILANAVKDLEDNQFKAEMLPFVSDLFSQIGRNCTYPARLITCNIPILKPIIKTVMTKIPPAASLVRTTTAVTMTSGSPAANVMPQKASATINFRQMPGVSTQDVEKHIKKVIKNKDVVVTNLKSKEASKFSPTDSRVFKIIDELCIQANPNNIVAPYLVMGGTDACFYEPICENIYRFAPFTVNTSLLLCTHATNERLPINTVEDGVGFFKRYIRRASAEN